MPVNGASAAAVSSSASRLWIDDREAELIGERELRVEEAPLLAPVSR